MTVVISTPVDVVNAALGRLGIKARVGTLYEGSVWSKLALDNYGQERDAELREGNWDFASRQVALTLRKTAPAAGYSVAAWSITYPPQPWKYCYTYPSDALKIRSIKKPVIFLPDFDPQPVAFDTPNDTFSGTPNTTEKVIVCNVASAVAVYAGRVTDPAAWEPSFAEALIARMAVRLAPGLNPQMLQAEAADDQVSEAKADVTQG